MVLDMTKDRILTLGRSNGSDIRFKHHSISRDHCKFILNKKGFFLKDMGSKYGTFVDVHNRQIKKNENIIF